MIRDECAQAHGTLEGEYNGQLGERHPGMLLLDGDGDFVRVEGNLYYPEAITVMGWVRTFRIGGKQTVIDVVGRADAAEQVALGVDFIQGTHVWVSYAGTTYIWNERLPISTRTHLAAACSPEGVALYIDGRDMGPHDGKPVPTPPVEVEETTFIGRANLAGKSSNEFYGEIEQASVYHSFLTANEAALAMHSEKKEGYTDLFEHGAGPTEHWDDFDGNGFSEQLSLLQANGFRGPHHIMATAPTTDHEVSFWYRYTDYRDRADLRAGEHTIRFSVRRDLWGTADLYVEISPESFSVHERIGRTTCEVHTNDQVKSEPNAWYSVRMRVVGDAIRVWRRTGDGRWSAPVIRVDGALVNSYTGAGYGFTIDAPEGGSSEYSLDNFRVRSYGGDIDVNVDEIDVHRLIVATPAKGTCSIVPSGGVYPHQECVYVAAEGTGDYVFQGWEPVDADIHNAPNAQDLRITLEAPVTLTPKLRRRYGGSDAVPYDSNYAPAGYTTITFADLLETYTLDMNTPDPADDRHYQYLPATVILTVPDYPDDDPLRKVVIDSVDAAKNTTLRYPVGAQITAQAIPMCHPLGFSMHLFAWSTTPGTAIHNSPTPGKRHQFTVPPLDNESDTFVLDIIAPVEEQVVTVVFPSWGEPTMTLGISKGVLDIVPISHFPGQAIWRYHIIAPRGAVGSVESNCIDLHEKFRSPVGLINPRSGMPTYTHGDTKESQKGMYTQ